MMQRIRYLVGLVTLIVAFAGAAFLWQMLRTDESAGHFRLAVEFRNVRGLKDGADVRYRGVVVGVVRKVELRNDARKGLVTVSLYPGREPLACANSQFWIVTPRFSGLAAGATGLDTLVRDAYVAFVTPEPFGPAVTSGSMVIGLERPFLDETEGVVEPVKHGDLLMKVLVPENHALGVGAPVLFRGMQTGEVRAVQLATQGTHVEVDLRIDRRFRTTVTDKSEFWIARPRLSGALLRGISVDDIGALLNPFVAYHTEPGKGVPVADAYRVAAVPERPSHELTAVPAEALRRSDPAAVATDSAPRVRLVRITYEAIDVDWLSPNDEIRRQGTGIVLADVGGRSLVVTTRTVCDGAYFWRDSFGADPDIEREQISVALPDGPVLRAVRAWVDPNGADLAVLVLEDPPPDLATTPAVALEFGGDGDEAPAGDRWRAVSADGERGATLTESPPKLTEDRGAVRMADDRATALLGQVTGVDESPRWVPLRLLPQSLRPKP